MPGNRLGTCVCPAPWTHAVNSCSRPMSNGCSNAGGEPPANFVNRPCVGWPGLPGRWGSIARACSISNECNRTGSHQGSTGSRRTGRGWWLSWALGYAGGRGLRGGLGLGLVAGLTGGLTGYSREITSIETVRWSWSGVLIELFFPSVYRVLSGLAVGLGFGLGLGVLVGIKHGLEFALLTGLCTAFSITLVGGLGIGLGGVLTIGLTALLVAVKTEVAEGPLEDRAGCRAGQRARCRVGHRAGL